MENSDCDFAGWLNFDRIKFIRNQILDQKKQWKAFWTSVSCFLIYQAVGVECDRNGFNEFILQLFKSFLSDANVSFGWVQHKQHHKEKCLGSGIGFFGLIVWQKSF